jgi:hypothetical protein
MAGPPFNFHVKIYQGVAVVFINSDHIIKIEYTPGADAVTLTLSDGSRETISGTLAMDIIARCESIPIQPIRPI